jgi:hypothetical protein
MFASRGQSSFIARRRVADDLPELGENFVRKGIGRFNVRSKS